MSSIRSASSKTRYVTLLKFVWCDSNISIRRPGVAITISTPDRRKQYINILHNAELGNGFIA